MKLKVIKATLLVAFIVLTVFLTFFGLNTKEASIDFKALEKKRAVEMSKQTEESFSGMLKNIGSTSNVVKPDILNSTDTGKLSLSIQLLDTMKNHVYAAVLSEKLAAIQNSPFRYHMAARYFLKATEKHENELMLYKKAKQNLEKCLDIDTGNLDAQVDLAVCYYNINLFEAPESQTDLMKPALLLREVVKKNPNHVEGIYFLAQLSLETKQYEKAIERFKKLVSLQPQNLEFYSELVRIYKLMGNESEAKVWVEKARAATNKKQ